MENLQLNGFEYRIKRMNAIETLALQSQISFASTEDTIKCYNTLLERLEVKVNDDKWLPVKDKNIYYPDGIENDVDAIQDLITYFLQYLKSVFQKSNASK